MHTVTSFDGSAVGDSELTVIIAEYLALERVRVFRRLLLVRCGLLALTTGLIGIGLHRLSMFASWFGISAFLTLPASAWIVEIRRDLRLGRRLAAIRDAKTAVVTISRSDA